jgi:hypothetical protein
MSWFSRTQAMSAANNASTATLKSALTNYINATKNMNANAIRKALNIKMGPLARNNYKNRIANGVANAVIKARKANVLVNAAKVNVVPEVHAATAVQQATTAMNNLNRAIANINTTNFANNAAKNAYRTKLMNIVKAKGIALNNSRLTAAFNKLTAKALRQANNNTVAGFNALPGNNAVANSKTKTKRLNNMVTGNNGNTMTGNMFKQANNAAAQTPVSNFNKNLKNELNKTTNNKLKSNITNNSQANALASRVRNAARAAGKNENQNVKNALARINAHKNNLMKPKN